jgi:hypothetical protein
MFTSCWYAPTLVQVLIELCATLTPVLSNTQALTGIFGGKDAGENHQGENDETLTKDRFGLRKLVVVTTQSGKVYALHSVDGSIAWSKFVRDSVPLSLFLSRSASHPPPVGVVVGRDTYVQCTPHTAPW